MPAGQQHRRSTAVVQSRVDHDGAGGYVTRDHEAVRQCPVYHARPGPDSDDHVTRPRDQYLPASLERHYPACSHDSDGMPYYPVYRPDDDRFRHQPPVYTRPTQPVVPVQYVSDEPTYQHQTQSQPADYHHYQLGTLRRYPSTSQVLYDYQVPTSVSTRSLKLSLCHVYIR